MSDVYHVSMLFEVWSLALRGATPKGYSKLLVGVLTERDYWCSACDLSGIAAVWSEESGLARCNPEGARPVLCWCTDNEGFLVLGM